MSKRVAPAFFGLGQPQVDHVRGRGELVRVVEVSPRLVDVAGAQRETAQGDPGLGCGLAAAHHPDLHGALLRPQVEFQAHGAPLAVTETLADRAERGLAEQLGEHQRDLLGDEGAQGGLDGRVGEVGERAGDLLQRPDPAEIGEGAEDFAGG